MIGPIANDSFLGWCRFALARDFITVQSSQQEDGRAELFQYEQTTLERCGRALRFGVGSVLDLLLREIKNPITIVALTALASIIVTIAFYPTAAISTISTVLPFVASIEPWMLKMAVYVLLQTTIVGLGLRAYGRFINADLVKAWRDSDIEPLFIGTKTLVHS